MNKSLNNKILEKIQQEQIQPKPKWQFTLKEIALWVGTGISLVLASVAAGSFIFQSVNAPLVPPHLFLWFGLIRIAVIILFIILAIYQIVRIARGYKRTKQIYLIIGLIIIGIIGSVFFASRISGNIERGIGRGGLVTQAIDYWSQPHEGGLLAGELIEVTNDGYLLIQGLDDSTHIVDARFIETKDHEIFIDFLRVKMVGYEDEGIFYPCAVEPWEIRRAGGERHPEYQGLIDGNQRFNDIQKSYEGFRKIFERKNDIIRTKICQEDVLINT